MSSSLLNKLSQTLATLAIPPQTPLLVALSGGIDSISLLSALHQLGEWPLHALHINYHLRGSESDQNEQFCRSMCNQWQIPLQVIDAPIQQKSGVQEAARAIRIKHLQQAAHNLGIAYIVLAHHQNDLAETVLFQLSRGSLWKGISSLQMQNGPFIRPFLAFSRNEIEQWWQQQPIDFAQDSSNLKETYARNRIRHQILPRLVEINAGTIQNLADFAQAAYEIEILLDDLAEQAYCQLSIEPIQNGIRFSKPDLPLPVLKRFYEKIITYQLNAEIQLHKRHCHALHTIVHNQEILLPRFQVARYYDWIHITRLNNTALPSNFPIMISQPGQYVGEHYQITVAETPFPDRQNTLIFDAAALEFPLSLRHRKPGDRIFQKGQHKKLKKLFQEKKISLPNRDKLLILSDMKKICWVEKVGYSSLVLPHLSTTKKLYLQIDHHPDSNR